MRKIAIILLLISGFNLLNSGVSNVEDGIKFSYDAPQAQEVFLAGSFNNWEASTEKLQKDDKGVWHTILDLSPGEYEYKFFVDGNWYHDPDHTNVKDDGYGGTNSLIKVNEDGKLAEIKSTNQSFGGVPSNLHPKVFFTGRYYVQNIFQMQNERYMLDKPEHDIDLGLRIKLNNNFEGYTLLNVNNNAEGTDMWKTHFNYKRAYLKLNTNYFSLNGFDDIGVYTSDDPLHMIGDIGKYSYALGYGYRGVMFQTANNLSKRIFEFVPELNFNTTLIYSDKLGDDETDLEAGRIKFDYNISRKNQQKNGIKLGGTFQNVRIKATDDILQKHNSLAADAEYYHNIHNPGWLDALKFNVQGQYYNFQNLDEYQSYGSDSLIVAKDFTWLEGDKYFIGSSISFPAALEIYMNFKHTNLDFHLPAGLDSINVTPSYLVNDRKLQRNALTLGADLDINLLKSSWKLEYWTTQFPEEELSWENYYRYLEKTDGNGRWFQEYSEVPFAKYTLIGYEKGLLWETWLNYEFHIFKRKLKTGWKGKFAHSGFLKEPKFIENIFELEYSWSKKWKLYNNTRLPYYNDEMLGIETDIMNDEDFFISSYAALIYRLSNNVRLSLGWGVNPKVLNNVTNEFYEGGREEFLEDAADFADYIESTYLGLGNKIRTAEEKLMKENRISLEAVVTF